MMITMLTESLGSGGAERQLCTLAVEMKRRGHSVKVVTYAPGDFYRPMLLAAGVKHVFLGGNGTWEWLKRIRSFLRHESQDVVLAFLQSCASYAELSALPYRSWGLVVSERIAIPNVGNGLSRLKKCFHLIADIVTVNSHANRLLLEKAVPGLKNRMVTIYNAVDLDKFKPSGSPRNSEELLLVVAARVNKQKNLMGLIEALNLLRKRQSNRVSVKWFGNTEDDPQLYRQSERRIRELGLSDCFSIYPPTRDIIFEYQQSDAVLLPSFYEGLPNTICEAMACGKPILMSAVCDAGNLVKNGQNGFLFSPHDPNDIANSIEKFASSSETQRRSMGEASRQMAEEYFDIVRIADLYESVLASASQRKHPTCRHWLQEVPWTAIPHNDYPTTGRD